MVPTVFARCFFVGGERGERGEALPFLCFSRDIFAELTFCSLFEHFKLRRAFLRHPNDWVSCSRAQKPSTSPMETEVDRDSSKVRSADSRGPE